MCSVAYTWPVSMREIVDRDNFYATLGHVDVATLVGGWT